MNEDEKRKQIEQNNHFKFMKKLFDILKKEEIINTKVSTSKEKLQVLENYLKKLDRVQSKMVEKDKVDYLKKLYYDKYVIKKEDIPDSYWHHLEENYLKEGHGHIDLVNPKTTKEKTLKRQHQNSVIREQKVSLDGWIDYLISSDSDYLPMWGKVWAFQGMLEIGSLNDQKEGYTKRNKETVSPFINMNPELIGKSIEYLQQYLKRREFEEKELEDLVRSESFKTIYSALYLNQKKIKITSNEGIWVKYERTDKTAAKRLYDSLIDYNTGWCTIDTLSKAEEQLYGGEMYQGGDFYVYYTKDENNKYKIPRLAILMAKDKIDEVRGIGKEQNVENGLEEILKEKLKEFPDGQLYQKKVKDMEDLTKIYKKYQDKEALNQLELRFIYEIDDDIEGFGFVKDPRISEIIDSRDQKNDYIKIFECKEEEIGFEETDLNKHLVVFIGDIDLSEYNKVEEIPYKLSLNYFKGDLDLWNLKKGFGLILPQNFKGNIDLSGLIDAEGLVLPKTFAGKLYLSDLTKINGLILPQKFRGDLYLNSLSIKDMIGLKLPEIEATIYTKDGNYKINEIKKLIDIETEKMNLNNQKEMLANIEPNSLNSRRGNINLIFIILPASILLGIIIASLFLK